MSQRLYVDVPFAFQFGNSALPEGEYDISRLGMSTAAVQFRSATLPPGNIFTRSGPSAVYPIMTVEPLLRWDEARVSVVFNKYGEDRYFVSEIWAPDSHIVFRKSSQERELITSRLVTANRPQTVTVVARLAR
jgi:hypothetical protein